ncbi:glycerophosphodiester phosphodiesterase family protein [Falsiruegeria litorea]|uniref:Glycerophosphodiester phosphodiesterase n=1 Tax=Falsiruegeria litorea TaxID=1280831 RepID=A0ABS5WRV1_9RHOB|nr:glycerophosphodiester phosphodiesterase [Falsiruegeria litorea]MBT8167407.1 glycerophosphodiester phosphodiesterase [Falsiruegeria litorea]
MSHFSTITRAFADAWARRRVFVPLYLSVRLLLLALVAPGVAGAINLAVSLSDQPALTDQDIAFFILSPLGFLATLTVLSLFLVAEVLSFSVMAASLRYRDSDLWQTARYAFALVVGRLRHLLLFAVHFVLRVLALMLPFVLIAGAIAWWALTEYDINYYLTFHPPEFMVAVGLIVVVVLAMAAVLLPRLSGWALALHLVLFENVAPNNAFKESTHQMAGKRTRLKIELALWLLMRVALAAAIAVCVTGLIAIIPVSDEGGLRLALTLSLSCVALGALAGLVLSATALGALAALLDGFFEGKTPSPQTVSGQGNFKARLIVVLGATAVAVVAGIWMSSGLLEQVQAEDSVEIIAHRGAAGLRPENTMASIQKAIEDQADWVEIDVQETADDIVVVMHDSDFMKLAGVNLTIWDATMEDLADIDIGSWFDPAYADERTPTLRAVLEAAKDKAKVLIELKYYGHDVDLENRVIALVEELGMQDQVATMSLKYPAVLKMKELRPDWRSGVLAATAVGNLAGLDGDFLAVNANMATPGLIRSVQETGKELYVWTVNDPLKMSKMISMGVDGLITDEPALVHEVLSVRAQLSPAERLLLWMTEELGLEIDAKEYRDDNP